MKRAHLALAVAALALTAGLPAHAAVGGSKPKPAALALRVKIPGTIKPGASISLDSRKSVVPRGDSVTYTVSYGDKSRKVTGKGLPHGTHKYPKAGTYTVVLSITDLHHKTVTVKYKVAVKAPAVVVNPIVPAPAPAPVAPVAPVAPAPVAPAPVQPAPVPVQPAPTTAPPTTAPPTTAPPTTAPPTTAPPSSTPAPAHPAKSIVGGADFTCALVTDGTVDCWGDNSDGQLGDNTTTEHHVPTKVPGLSGVTALAAGASHVCALLSAGTVECWGYNGDGELGLGDQTDRHKPTVVPDLSGVTALAAGKYFTCAVNNNTVACWGSDLDGQLGDGYDNGTSPNISADYSPRDIALNGATSITAGYYHACAVVTGGKVSCWGDNGNGQLGLGAGSKPEYDLPQQLPSLSGVTSIAAGSSHTCALSSGSVACWGDNTSGDLGDGGAANEQSPSTLSLTGVAAVTAGGANTCALLTSGGADCWGYNYYGQVGDGTTTDRPTPTAVSGLTGAKVVASSQYWHTCAVLSDGSVECWGSDSNGQLGHGDPVANENTPTPTSPLP